MLDPKKLQELHKVARVASKSCTKLQELQELQKLQKLQTPKNTGTPGGAKGNRINERRSKPLVTMHVEVKYISPHHYLYFDICLFQKIENLKTKEKKPYFLNFSSFLKSPRDSGDGDGDGDW